MKFLNVFCETRKAEVYISLDKIVIVEKINEELSRIELDGTDREVKVAMPAADLIRKINGEDKVTIGFRAGR